MRQLEDGNLSEFLLGMPISGEGIGGGFGVGLSLSNYKN